jgi:hypothetical protein
MGGSWIVLGVLELLLKQLVTIMGDVLLIFFYRYFHKLKN